ncbi:MAG TPA: DUF4440 domain-containing protein [Candidatus Pacebacteria bacterium]|nr:DUF4440 domain-containing protein [Candidatus Paceibacterota bacterium]
MDSKQLAQDIFTRWNESLQTKDKQKVAEMYSKDATFLPTLSGELKRGVEGAVAYFEHFLQKDPFGIIVESVTKESADGGTIIYSGLYDFSIGPSDARETVNARFTYVFQKK